MIELFEYPHTVGADEIDEQGRANNVVYVAWMQEAAIAHSAVLGWTPERYLRLGMGWVARSHWIEYLQPAMAGDEIIVETRVCDMKKVTSKRVYRILRRGRWRGAGQSRDELGLRQLRHGQTDADSAGDRRRVSAEMKCTPIERCAVRPLRSRKRLAKLRMLRSRKRPAKIGGV